MCVVSAILSAIGLFGPVRLSLVVALLLVASVVLVSRSVRISLTARVSEGKTVIGLILVLTFVNLLTAAVLVRHAEIERSGLSLMLLAALWSVIFMQSIIGPVSRRYFAIVLLETAGASLFSFFSVNLAYPIYNGLRDFLFHASVTQQLISTGVVPGGPLYSTFPGLHLVAAAGSEISALPPLIFLPILVAVAMVSTIPTLYVLSLHVSGNHRIALVGAVLFASSADFQMWGKFSVPTSLGFVFVIHLIVVAYLARPRTSTTTVVLLLAASLVITHPLTSALGVVILLLVSIRPASLRPGRGERGMSNGSGLAVVVAILMLTYWVYIATEVFGSYVPLLNLAFQETTFPSFGAQIGILDLFLRNGPVVVLSALYLTSFTSIWLNKQAWNASGLSVTFAPSLLLPVSLGQKAVSSPTLGSSGLNLGRWSFFAAPFVSQIIAVFLIAIETRRARVAATTLLLVLLITNIGFASFDYDSPLIGSSVGRSRDFFSTPEIGAANFVELHTSGHVTTDFTYASLFSYYGGSGINVSYTYSDFTGDGSIHVIRIRELGDRGLVFGGTSLEYFTPVLVAGDVRNITDPFATRLYDNGQVVIETSG